MKIRVKLQESVPVIVKLRELSVIKIKTAELMIYRLLRSKVGVGVGLNSAIVHLLGRIKTRLGVGIGTNGHANAKKRMQHIDFGVGTDMDADPTLSKKIEVQFGEGVGVRATGSSEKKIPEQKVGFGAGFNANVFYRELIDTRFGFGAAILRVQGVLMHKFALKRIGVGSGMRSGSSNVQKAMRAIPGIGSGVDFTVPCIRKTTAGWTGVGAGFCSHARQRVVLSPVRFGAGLGMSSSAVAAELTKLGQLDGLTFAELDNQTIEQMTYRIIE